MCEKRPIPVAAHSEASVCGNLLGGVAGSNRTGGMKVSFECCVLSGRDLYDGPTTRTEDSHRVRCDYV